MSVMKPGDFSAFPIQASDAQGSLYAEVGLTKREYLAAMAMQGLLANSIPGSHHGFKQTARDAVEYADELLAALHPKTEKLT